MEAKYIIVPLIVLIVGQTVGIFLAAFQDGFGLIRSLLVVKEMWIMYLAIAIMPLWIVWKVWRDPIWFFNGDPFTKSLQIKMTFIAVFKTYYFVAQDVREWRNEIFNYYQPTERRFFRIRIGELTFLPIKHKLLHV